MSYDQMGRRREKNAQQFFYDGYLQVADNTGNAYSWDCSESIATRPLAWLCVDFAAYYFHDGNKNVSEVVAADGSLAAHYWYAPFGAVTARNGKSAVASPWRFSSEYADDELGCDYYNYREYEPVTGRWGSRDPGGEDEILSYVFLRNVVLLKFDWLGLKDCNCKVCVYSAINRAHAKDSPLRYDDGMSGHTWFQLEDCDSNEDRWVVVANDDLYSFGPERGHNSDWALFWGVKSGTWDVDGYNNFSEYRVVKKCWSMGKDECCSIKRDMKSQFPDTFSIWNYCTSQTVSFLRDHGIDVPEGSGKVDISAWLPNFERQNPKDMADQLQEMGGVELTNGNAGYWDWKKEKWK